MVEPWRTLHDNPARSEEHTSELQSLRHLVCRLLLEKKNRFNESAIIRSGVLVRKPIAPFCQQPMATCPRRTAILTPAFFLNFGTPPELNPLSLQRTLPT